MYLTNDWLGVELVIGSDGNRDFPEILVFFENLENFTKNSDLKYKIRKYILIITCFCTSASLSAMMNPFCGFCVN